MRSVLAPCKINLGLHVLRKRPDGFRDIDTVFLRIPWCDEIFYEHLSGGVREMSNSDSALPTDERNLCMAAAVALAESMGVSDGFQLHLDKRVPYGAGLGSGSSDAAAVLMMLADEWGAVTEGAGGAGGGLQAIAATLGSDVPFFLGSPVARGTGRGEELTPMEWQSPFSLVVAVPDVHVPTGPAYALVEPRSERRADLVDLIASNDLERWRAELVNDFQEPIIRAYPAVGAVLDALRDAGAGYAAMSGSGSAVYGVFESAGAARGVAEAMEMTGCRAWTDG
ncbi:MAG: 4-diphosphocytidyl-2-C-methyl-D-erythritol kinase [Rhodothermales bacterium]|jgi:4-diphosphocytidyl-2-C-methyl-D-erythritol kinase